MTHTVLTIVFFIVCCASLFFAYIIGKSSMIKAMTDRVLNYLNENCDDEYKNSDKTYEEGIVDACANILNVYFYNKNEEDISDSEQYIDTINSQGDLTEEQKNKLINIIEQADSIENGQTFQNERHYNVCVQVSYDEGGNACAFVWKPLNDQTVLRWAKEDGVEDIIRGMVEDEE